jgi:PAS domain S-box-containing protein
MLVALEDVLADSFIVLKTTSAQKALELARADPDIAVVVTDQRMPKMTGDELLQSLAEHSEAQRIMVTGFADLNAVVRAVNHGKLFAYVTKPWSPDDLLQKVDLAAQQFLQLRTLASEGKLLRDLMHHSTDGIYFKDRKLRFVATNKAFRDQLGIDGATQLTGKTLEELLGESHLTAAVKDDEQKILDAINGPLNGVRAYSVPNHAPRWLSEMRAPITHTKSVVGMLGISRDVTLQRELEQRFADIERMEAVGRLAGGVAHDFNNLLSIIQCSGELLLSALPPTGIERDDVVLILDAAQRAGVLTGQLLSFTGQQVQRPRVLQLNEVVRALETMTKRALGSQVELHFDLSEPLWNVRMDASQLERAILNLALNARDAMANGGRLYIGTRNVCEPEARPEASNSIAADRYVLLSVRDTGTGMSPETRRRIFEPFFTTKDVGKGSGLGLATAHGIVEQQGGQIHCDSTIGQGTEFRLYLARDESAEKPAGAAPERRSRPEGSLILLVEDEENLRHLAAGILRKQGYGVLEADGPARARQLHAEHAARVDVLLTDIVMPGGTGPQLAKELLARRKDLKVVYMTGFAGDGAVVDRALYRGAQLLEKPFTPTGLCQAVATALATIA